MSQEPNTAKNIYQKILEVMKKVEYIQKEDKKVNNQYTFVSHDAVTMALHNVLVECGIAVLPTTKQLIQDGNRTSVELEITFVNVDKPDDKFTTSYWGYGIDTQDKGPGKAVSYAFKYAMLKTFCLVTGDDPEKDSIDYDNNQASVEKKSQQNSSQNNATVTPMIEKVNKTEIIALTNLMNGLDKDINKSFLEWIKKEFKATSVQEIPKNCFDKCMASLNAKIKYMKDQEKTMAVA